MFPVGFEPTIPLYERAATVIGHQLLRLIKFLLKDICRLIGGQLDTDRYCDWLPIEDKDRLRVMDEGRFL
jgi:hypothetical protein